MLRRYFSSTLLTALLLCLMASGLMASNAKAQESRPEGLYIRARVGANSYAGDRDLNPDNDPGEFFENSTDFPSLGVDLGYMTDIAFFNGGVALSYTGGGYTNLISDDVYGENATGIPNVAEEESSDWRHTLSLNLRAGFAPDARVNPYITLGGHATYANILSEYNANNPDEDLSNHELSFGPRAGIGLDFALTPRIGLFLEATGTAHFPDDHVDLSNGVEEEHEDFDVLGFYGGGLRYSFGSVFTPVEIVSLDCPTELQVGESGTFTATINEGEATTPISSDWEFGDGTTATGLVATKTYNSPGTYTVTFNTSNNGASANRNCTVEVEEAPQPAVVASIDSNPNPSEPGESVSFTSNVRGDRPIECEWDFGDGEGSSNCNPTHTYDEPGSYNVTFTASNEYGSDTASLTQVVEEEQQLADICTNVTEFNAAFFERNSSTLSSEARDNLRDNLEILEQCPNLCVDVEGFASRAERNPDELSQDRADAVAEFYEDNGIDASRIDAEGMGARGQSTKKGGNAQFRRADSIPESCDPAGVNSDDDPAVGSNPDFDEDDMMDDGM